MAKIIKSILHSFKKLNSKIRNCFTKDSSKDKNTEIPDDYHLYDGFLGITPKSIELSKKVNGEIGKWPTSKLNKFLDNDSARRAIKEGEELYYDGCTPSDLGITKKSITLSKKVNNELGNLPEDEMNRYLKSDYIRRAAEQGKDMFYQF